MASRNILTVQAAAASKGWSVTKFVKFFLETLSKQQEHAKSLNLRTSDCKCPEHYLFDKDTNQSISQELSRAYETTSAILMLLPREHVLPHAEVVFNLEHWVDVWQGVKTWDDVLAQLNSVA